MNYQRTPKKNLIDAERQAAKIAKIMENVAIGFCLSVSAFAITILFII